MPVPTVLVLVLTFNFFRMKTTKIFTVLFFMVALASCKKFLDIDMNNTQTPIRNTGDLQLILDNYNVMNTGYPSDGSVSADEYSINPASTVLNNLEDKNQYLWEPSAIHALANPQWQKPYNTVYHANLVMEYAKRFRDANETDEMTYNSLVGASKFFRAFSFWQLAQLYAKPYSASASTDFGIPLRLSPDVNEISKRATVEGTYGQIIQDLKDAIQLLPFTSASSSRPNKVAAYAMLARVYLGMGDYASSLANADACLKLKNDLIDFSSLNSTAATPFTRFHKEVIFHAIINPSPLLNPGAENNAVAIIDPEVVNLYQANDYRKSIFLKQNKTGTAFNGTYRFSGNYEQQANGNLFTGLAVDEVYLIRAEGYARMGKALEAMSDINTLLKTRWNTNGGTTPYVDMTANNADEALAKILIERRKELLMRGSIRWMDLRRLNKDSRFRKDLSRSFTANNVTTVYSLPADDLRYTLLIPQEVILNSSIQQNNR